MNWIILLLSLKLARLKPNYSLKTLFSTCNG
jgi:hypothetical protein